MRKCKTAGNGTAYILYGRQLIPRGAASGDWPKHFLLPVALQHGANYDIIAADPPKLFALKITATPAADLPKYQKKATRVIFWYLGGSAAGDASA